MYGILLYLIIALCVSMYGMCVFDQLIVCRYVTLYSVCSVCCNVVWGMYCSVLSVRTRHVYCVSIALRYVFCVYCVCVSMYDMYVGVKFSIPDVLLLLS
jgi:hypothetical protein